MSGASKHTVFKFQCNNDADWSHLKDGKVNQFLVNATYLDVAEGEVLRTRHINNSA